MKSSTKQYIFNTCFYAYIACMLFWQNASVLVASMLYLMISAKILDILFLKKISSNNSVILSEYRSNFRLITTCTLILTFGISHAFIPSSSMRPTLSANNSVIVSHLAYHAQEPITKTILFSWDSPKNGDVITFNYPEDTSRIFTKRIIGIPGDTISYVNKQLVINNSPINQQFVRDTSYKNDNSIERTNVNQYVEKIGNVTHAIYLDRNKPTYFLAGLNFKSLDFSSCKYFDNGFTCKIPKNKYLVLGDNRDNSADSRYWGFVDISQINGKVIYSLISYDDKQFSFFKSIN